MSDISDEIFSSELQSDPDEIEKNITTLEKRLTKAQDEFQRILSVYKSANVTPNDAFLKIYKMREKLIQKKIDDGLDRLKLIRSEVAAGETKPGFGTMLAAACAADARDEAKFSDAAVFEAHFIGSVRDWVNTACDVLDEMEGRVGKPSGKGGIDAKKIAGVVGKLFKGAAPVVRFVGIGQDFYDEVTRVAKLPMADVQNLVIEMNKALRKVPKDQAKMHKRYERFVRYWKKTNRIPEDQETIRKTIFSPECVYFADNNMPSVSDVRRGFLTEIMKMLKDDEFADWDEDGTKAGYAELKFKAHMDDNKLHAEFIKGSLNDVDSTLTKELKREYAGVKVLDMPLQIEITILFSQPASSGAGTITSFQKLWRYSRKPGNTEFHGVTEPIEAGNQFLQQGHHKQPTANDL